MAQVKPVNKKKMTKSALIATIVSIAILVAFVLSLLASSGLFVRLQTAASSDNFTVNGSMMSYFTNSYYMNWYSNYYYYILYGLVNFDPNTPLDEQYVDAEKTQTYYDFFVEGAKASVTNYLKYCEAAKADSTVNFAELEAEAKEYANDSIKSLKDAAKESETDFTTYVRQRWGKNVSESDLRKALVIEHIASDYAQTVYDRMHDATTSKREEKYFGDNLASFISADYLVYTLPSEVEPEEVDEKEFEGGKDSQEYKDAVAAAQEKAKKLNEAAKIAHQEVIDKLATAKTVEEFKKFLLEEKYNSEFKTAYDAAVKSFKDEEKPSEEEMQNFAASVKGAIIDAVIAGKTSLDSDSVQSQEDTELSAWEKAKNSIPTSIITALTKVITNATKSATYTLESDLGKFLFGGVKAQYGIEGETEGTSAAVNTTYKFDKEMSEEEQKSGKYSLSVYFVTEAAHRDETALRNVGHVLFKVDTAKDTDPAVSYKTSDEAKAAAEKLLEQIKAETNLTKEKFEEFGKSTHDDNVFYDDVNKGEMEKAFEDWLFAAKTEGEVGLVETSYGWHVMYYGGESGNVAWRVTARDGATEEDMEKWFEELTYTVTINEAIFDQIFN